MSDSQTPLIYDESLDSSYWLDERFGSPFAEGVTDKSGALLSIPAHDKVQSADMYDYHTTGALHDPSAFGVYAQPHYGPHLHFPSDLTGSAQDQDFEYAAAPGFTQFHDFASHRSSISDIRLREAPDILSATLNGVHGRAISLSLESVHDFACPTPISFSFIFGCKRTDAVVELASDVHCHPRQYVVTGIVPPFITTGSHSAQVSFYLRMDGSDGTSAPFTLEVGLFTYDNLHATPSNSRKRKASDGSDYDVAPPTKKIAQPQLTMHEQSVDSYDFNTTSPYSSFVPTPTAPSAYVGSTNTASPRPSGHQYSTSSTSQVSLTAPSPHTPAFSPSFTTVKTEHSPRQPLTPIQRPASTPAPGKTPTPALVRTSTIQQSPPSLSSIVGASMHTQDFNPYAMPNLKAFLKLNGNLDDVANHWAPEEYAERRRLVEFSRTQNGSTIHASFKVVAPEDKNSTKPTISCIWWEEKNECYVTSVDTIYLLEALVAVRFTVEEKNRIRRNLEGFHPLTVSKSKADSENFFKCIMNFPTPKPRNIEKDVKVFPWSILSKALKKIIGKYSASYSSTASAIPPQISYVSAEASTDYATGSPRDDLLTSSTSAYPITTTAGYSSTMTPNRMYAPMTPASVPDLRLQMPMMAMPYQLPDNNGFQSMPPHPNTSPAVTHAMSAPASTHMPPSWEFVHFFHQSPASTTAQSAPTPSYARPAVESAEFGTPPHYSTGK